MKITVELPRRKVQKDLNVKLGTIFFYCGSLQQQMANHRSREIFIRNVHCSVDSTAEIMLRQQTICARQSNTSWRDIDQRMIVYPRDKLLMSILCVKFQTFLNKINNFWSILESESPQSQKRTKWERCQWRSINRRDRMSKWNVTDMRSMENGW